jgi:tRNA1Val (adenine37-N6)-methyltransferase
LPQPFFAFKQFKILHDRCAMKVNTDGCLLGAWASAANPTFILDIGAGTGLIGLMLAQRYPNALVDLVEIEPHCAEQCAENVQHSPFAKRVFVHKVAIQQFKTDKRYDLIVSNPPYFENAMLSANEKRKLARHHTTLTLEELVVHANQMLSATGTFCVIIPQNRKDELVAKAAKNGLQTHKLVAIRSLPNKPISRYLVAFTKPDLGCLEAEITLEVEAGTYSEIAKKWLAPFYLHL